LEKDSKALTIIPENQVAVPVSTTTSIQTQNIQNQNNIQTQNNIQNQTNNISIVIYHTGDDGMTFNNQHIDVKELEKKLIRGSDKIDPARMSGVVRHYTRQLMACPENQCVKKTNMRSSHSQVYVGNDNWESRQDKEVYPNMMNNIANDFSGFLDVNYKKKCYKTLDRFIEYMASDGYCADDDDKEIENCYKNLVKELKLLTFDLSRIKRNSHLES
jgi:hypothetical protein